MSRDYIRIIEGTDKLRSIAYQIAQIGEEFHGVYTHMFTAIEADLPTDWRGADADAFREKSADNKPKFESLRETIIDFSEWITNTANEHERRMEESRNRAQSDCSFDD